MNLFPSLVCISSFSPLFLATKYPIAADKQFIAAGLVIPLTITCTHSGGDELSNASVTCGLCSSPHVCIASFNDSTSSCRTVKMKLSIVYTPSLKNIGNAFSLIWGGISLLLGREVSIESDITPTEFTKMVVDDLRRQAKSGELKMTQEELRTSLLAALDGN